MRKLIIALGVLGAVAGFAVVSAEAAAPRSGPPKFFDRNGGFRGYAWCLKQDLFIFDCNYFNFAQCQASASTRRVYCVPNPHAVEQGYNPWAAEQQQAVPVSRKRVRQQPTY